MSKQSGDGDTGCLGCVLSVLLVWALVFGVTVGGRHYGVFCSPDKGVEIKP